MVTRPDVTPETIPLVATMAAIAALLLVQVPPADGSVKVVVAPWHIRVDPIIGPGSGFTVTVADTLQPVPVE